MRIYNDGVFYKREIHILSSSHDPDEDRKYRFDFKTIDTLKDGERDEQRWVVYLKYEILNVNDLKYNEHKKANPLGIKITYYRGDLDKRRTVNIKEASND